MESRIQSYLRVASSHGRETERIGPFLGTFDLSTENAYLNYAIPDDGATPSPADIAALITAYERRWRKPRLEYISKLAPAVEQTLIDAGFEVERRTPLMVCTPGSEQFVPTPPGMELLVPTTDDEISGLMMAQNEAFGQALNTPDAEAIASFRSSMAGGMIAIMARDEATGEPAGGGVGTIPYDGITEIAGIGVREAYRRRGIAAALTSRLLQEAFAAGVTLPFLMAAAEAEERIYARAGFTTIGDVMHISRPTT
ncbi:MAG TPA: GNAT family N-acetyltransferase [Chloroflexia bacterium]|nr:GNAT family N-acetyltransferase [Chloroflexia bacterium]